MKRITLAVLATATMLSGCGGGAKNGDKLVVGFSQIGSESGWRTAETNAARSAATQRKVDLRISDAQQH